jgi:phosphoribosyl isomerase A
VSFTLFPAIDIRGGRAVRLTQGRADAETVYDADPVAVARRFAEEGAEWLHVVDLDAAFEGEPRNRHLIADIVEATGMPVQASGGIRSMADLDASIGYGASRVVIGTMALEEPSFVAAAVAEHGDKVAVGLDAEGTTLKARGWTTEGGDLFDALHRFTVMGVSASSSPTSPVTACSPARTSSGSPRSPSDDRPGHGQRRGVVARRPARLAGAHERVDAAIVGKALYAGASPCPRRSTSQRVAVGVMTCRRARHPLPRRRRGRVVKGVNFVDLRDAGDPVELARTYDAEGADELVFLDITASSDERETIYDVVPRPPSRCSSRSPSAAGCAVSTTCAGCCAQAPTRWRVNTAAVAATRAALRGAEAFGSQCVVAAIDARRRAPDDDGAGRSFIHGGRTPTGSDVVEWAAECERRGAGEILLTSMDRDGTKEGFDTELLAVVSRERAGDRLRRRRDARAHGRGRGAGRRLGRARRLDLPLRRAADRRGEAVQQSAGR